jgi:hypothetical protein
MPSPDAAREHGPSPGAPKGRKNAWKRGRYTAETNRAAPTVAALIRSLTGRAIR